MSQAIKTKKKGSRWGSCAPLIILAFILGALAIIAPGQFLQQATNQEEVLKIELLYVQVAESGLYAEPAGVPRITLQGVSDSTVWFADRPRRLTGQESTEVFIERWSEGIDSFTDNPPNAALEFITEEGESKIAIFELLNPVYDPERGTLSYEVLPLESATISDYHGSPVVQELPGRFDNATLFIDALVDDPCLYVGESCR